MEAGRLRHRITVQSRADVQDATTGDVEPAWETLGTIWGSIEPIRGREATYAGDQLLAEMDTRIVLRWSPLASQITGAHRLVHQGTLYNVVSAAQVNLERRRIEVMCKSGVNDG